MEKKYKVFPCPFCGKGEIEASQYHPSVYSYKETGDKSQPRSASGFTPKGEEEWLIQAACPKCGKTAKEITAALRKNQADEDRKHDDRMAKKEKSLDSLREEIAVRQKDKADKEEEEGREGEGKGKSPEISVGFEEGSDEDDEGPEDEE